MPPSTGAEEQQLGTTWEKQTKKQKHKWLSFGIGLVLLKQTNTLCLKVLVVNSGDLCSSGGGFLLLMC